MRKEGKENDVRERERVKGRKVGRNRRGESERERGGRKKQEWEKVGKRITGKKKFFYVCVYMRTRMQT